MIGLSPSGITRILVPPPPLIRHRPNLCRVVEPPWNNSHQVMFSFCFYLVFRVFTFMCTFQASLGFSRVEIPCAICWKCEREILFYFNFSYTLFTYINFDFYSYFVVVFLGSPAGVSRSVFSLTPLGTQCPIYLWCRNTFLALRGYLLKRQKVLTGACLVGF